MCGIYGIHRPHGEPVTAAAISAMGRLIVHRGPDDDGVYVDGACGLGVRRLSIIDPEGGHQPLTNEDRSLWLVCNGEIYNFRELRCGLEQRGHRFGTGSDCEVLLHLYEERGDDAVHDLNGMFAFALWDARRQRLLLGRDRLGIKPLYIYRRGGMLAFASEAKALLAVPGFSPAVDRAALGSYLQLGYVPGNQSLFQGVEKIPPATLLAIDARGENARRYWHIGAHVDTSIREEEWIVRVRERLTQSVRMQMVSDVPIGAFLSGGIDSSTIVALMSQADAHPIRTYAVGFEGGDAERLYNELPWARRVADRFHTDHHEIVVRSDVVSLLPRLLWHLDEPMADTAFISTFLVSQLASRDVTVLLSGVGGDELFGGYRRYLGNHYQKYLQWIPSAARRLLAAGAGRLPADRHSAMLNLARLARGYLISADQPFEDRYRSYIEVFPRSESMRVTGDDTLRPDALGSSFELAAGDDSLNRMLVIDAQTQLPDDLLMLTDKMSMAVSVECRVPLLDHELVELAAQIPEDVKIRGGRLKHVMKEAMKPFLPAEILQRSKRGFGVPIGAWLKGDLAPVVQRLLSNEAIRSRGFFDEREVATLIGCHMANRVDGTDRLVALINLEIWCRIFLDGRTPDDVGAEIAEAAVP